MDYALQVYQSPILGNQLLETDIAPVAMGWRRSKRLIGGDWLGSFRLEGDYDKLAKWFNGYIGHRLKETIGNQVTWEGIFYDVVFDDTRDPVLRVKVAGDAHTLNWRYLTVGDDAEANASDWIDLILSTDCEFVVTRNIVTNTLQVVQATDMKRRAWDELIRIVAMGDASGTMYRLYFVPGGKVLYNTVSMSPSYFVNGGLVRRRSLEAMYNHVSGDYIDEDDETQVLAASSTTGSIVQYGRKEFRLVENEVPLTAMEKLQALVLQENSYPWGRVIGCSPDIQFFDDAGVDNSVAPWFIEPAVVRDVKFPYSGREYGSLFDDARDFLVDEIEVYTDRNGQAKISLKTSSTEESDGLETYFRELFGRSEDDDGSGGGGSSNHIPRSEKRGTKEYQEKFVKDNYTPEQIEWWKDKGYDWETWRPDHD